MYQPILIGRFRWRFQYLLWFANCQQRQIMRI